MCCEGQHSKQLLRSVLVSQTRVELGANNTKQSVRWVGKFIIKKRQTKWRGKPDPYLKNPGKLRCRVFMQTGSARRYVKRMIHVYRRGEKKKN